MTSNRTRTRHQQNSVLRFYVPKRVKTSLESREEHFCQLDTQNRRIGTTDKIRIGRTRTDGRTGGGQVTTTETKISEISIDHNFQDLYRPVGYKSETRWSLVCENSLPKTPEVSYQLERRNGGSAQDLTVDIIGKLVFLSGACVLAKIGRPGGVLHLVEANQHLTSTYTSGQLRLVLHVTP